MENTLLGFGKHRDKTYAQVFEEKGYVRWMRENCAEPSGKMINFLCYAEERETPNGTRKFREMRESKGGGGGRESSGSSGGGIGGNSSQGSAGREGSAASQFGGSQGQQGLQSGFGNAGGGPGGTPGGGAGANPAFGGGRPESGVRVSNPWAAGANPAFGGASQGGFSQGSNASGAPSPVNVVGGGFGTQQASSSQFGAARPSQFGGGNQQFGGGPGNQQFGGGKNQQFGGGPGNQQFGGASSSQQHSQFNRGVVQPAARTSPRAEQCGGEVQNPYPNLPSALFGSAPPAGGKGPIPGSVSHAPGAGPSAGAAAPAAPPPRIDAPIELQLAENDRFAISWDGYVAPTAFNYLRNLGPDGRWDAPKRALSFPLSAKNDIVAKIREIPTGGRGFQNPDDIPSWTVKVGSGYQNLKNSWRLCAVQNRGISFDRGFGKNPCDVA